MAIVSLQDAPEELMKIKTSLHGCSIVWQVENDLPIYCEMVECWQGFGIRKGTWNEIPSKMCVMCGTEHDSVFGAGNNGGVVYNIGTNMYFGIAWSDPGIGKSYYTYAFGPYSFVMPIIQKWANSFFTTCWKIDGGLRNLIEVGSLEILANPGFYPFKISFSSRSSKLDFVNTKPFFAGAEELQV